MSEEVKVTEEVTEAVEAVETAEVVEEVKEVIPSMADFEEEVNASMKKIYEGDVVKGQVITVTDEELLVNIDYIADGIVPATETLRTGDEKLSDKYKVGDTVNAEVLKKDDGQGNVLLSVKTAESVIVWDELEALSKNGELIEVTVAEAVKGGVVCKIKGVRAFIPASLLSAAYVEDLKEFVGKTFEVKVVDFDREKNKVILSRKAIEMEERKAAQAEFYTTVNVGDRFTGKVKKLMDFGAFVNIGAVDGLVRNQDLAWKRVKHPSEIVKEGETVDVYVINVDPAKRRIGLGLKDVKNDPFSVASKEFKTGSIVTGKVVKVESFGAFVRIADGFEGLVHISQLSADRVENTEDVVKEGDEVQVKVLEIDDKSRKIRLSMKAVKEAEDNKNFSQFGKSDENATTNLKDIFASVLKDIEK